MLLNRRPTPERVSIFKISLIISALHNTGTKYNKQQFKISTSSRPPTLVEEEWEPALAGSTGLSMGLHESRMLWVHFGMKSYISFISNENVYRGENSCKVTFFSLWSLRKCQLVLCVSLSCLSLGYLDFPPAIQVTVRWGEDTKWKCRAMT